MPLCYCPQQHLLPLLSHTSEPILEKCYPRSKGDWSGLVSLEVISISHTLILHIQSLSPVHSHLLHSSWPPAFKFHPSYICPLQICASHTLLVLHSSWNTLILLSIFCVSHSYMDFWSFIYSSLCDTVIPLYGLRKLRVISLVHLEVTRTKFGQVTKCVTTMQC